MSLQAPEPLGRFEDAGGDPAQHHLAAPPALHVAFDVAGPADEALDGVGRGQRALETRREAQRQHGHRLLEPFAHSACRNGHSALYVRVSRLLSELATARADGRYPRRLESLAKTEVLVMDDWGLTPFSAENRHDLLEVLEDRHGVRSTVVTSQLPIDKWHDGVGDPTLADAILDRLVHNAYKLDLKGDSMRKRRRPSTRTGNPDS